ncbi:hypothetical protein PLESTB_000470800 [Pleodorina starrii]|uniref:Protein kinase domain-containing protein n=1 Tax=Pleodorina starrii TaxID=330485 RepID=A0A9W6BF93_9CHLO|nr:hypothetical protein PLESTB_000470800 [Pleodorina starrii]GLC63504.1 hypothetical protein PLESTF_000043300 [Pleodorina starrii]
MSGRRKSLDGGGAFGIGNGPTGKTKMHLALLKLSTANAFAKGMNDTVTYGVQSSNGSVFFPDDSLGQQSSAAAAAGADATPPLSPTPIPRSPYYGMYADYEDVMELLHSAVIADGSARRLLSGVSPDQCVHVAHLGIGACCSVDLVALHCPDGSRLLAAAKSCYLPPSDPRLRASLREADLLRRCADCPFIMQLLAVMQHQEPAAAAAAGFAGAASPGAISPVGTPPRNSLQLPSGRPSFDLAAAGFAGAPTSSGGGGDGGAAAAAMAAMMSSPGFQAWAQWRGGGAAEDLERQVMQRYMAATAGSGGGGAGVGLDGGGGSGSWRITTHMGGGSVGGPMRLGSLAGSVRSSLSRWDSGLQEEPQDASCYGGGGGGGSGFGGVVAAAQGYGGGWAYDCGWGYGGGGCAVAASDGSGRPRLRRASMEIIDMYGGCAGMGSGWGGGGGAESTGAQAPLPGGGAEVPVMCTLLLGWARCGDLRRLVQLLLGRSPAHQNKHPHPHPQPQQGGGASPAMTSLPPLMPEDAARFYTACVVLALEHLHTKLHTVHRDLKLANLLLLDSGYVVVGDLGTAVDLSAVPGGRLTSRVGSPGHMAPECRDRDEAGYDTAADMWSLGACLFSLMTGQLPAGLAGPPHRQWSPPLSRHWSGELQGLVGRLLAWSPGQRPTVAQLLRDPWFRGFNWKALREQRMQPPGNTPWRELLWWPKENRQFL